MRRNCLHLFPLISILLLLPAFSYGQSWSSLLAPSRAITWTGAGLPASLPDGETAPNPWTPPTRTQCGATISSGASVSTINAALAACSTGTYVLLGPGTFMINSAILTLYAQSGVTLRGSGAQSTKIVLTGSGIIEFGIVWNNGSCAWTSGYSVGATSLTMNSCSGPALVTGELVYLTQCNTGLSGSGCTTGSETDNGGLFICGPNGTCSQQSRGDSNLDQVQTVYVNSVTGNCSASCTVSFTPGLYAPNWGSGNSPLVTWETSCSGGNCANPYGDGLEDLTVDSTAATGSQAVSMDNTYASWIKGVRFVGDAGGDAIYVRETDHCLVFNNYMFAHAITSGADAVFVQTGGTSDLLYMNNMVTGGQTWNGTGGNEGNVIAYNYGRDSQTSYYQLAIYDHEPGSAFSLREGNQTGLFLGDNTWGTQDLDTLFRNYLSGMDPTYTTAPNPRVVTIDNYVRFDNIIGNAFGSSLITIYQATSGWNFVYNFGSSDPLAESSSMRWGNCDTATNTCRFQSSEVPTSLTGNAVPFDNSVPSNQNLPCSFFLPGYTSTSCTPTYSGGTGLGFWAVCTSWATFPTSCAASQTQPFPIAGPDITGGSYVNGTAYDNPASIAFKSLPVDPNYQNSYSITGSSWSDGTETLTVSGLTSGSSHIIGPFQISGTGSGTCTTGPNNECFMTSSNSTSGTISYALASNPGNLAGGTVKFPDVRQFDERVYEADTGGGGNPPNPPTALTAIVN